MWEFLPELLHCDFSGGLKEDQEGAGQRPLTNRGKVNSAPLLHGCPTAIWKKEARDHQGKMAAGFTATKHIVMSQNEATVTYTNMSS